MEGGGKGGREREREVRRERGEMQKIGGHSQCINQKRQPVNKKPYTIGRVLNASM